MIIVIFVVALLLVFVGVKLYDKDFEYTGAFVGVASAAVAVVAFLAFIVLCVKVSELGVLDQKIQMYEEENARIEAQISEAVTQYQAYEKEVFVEVAPESAVTLVALYPELKADTLVQKQVEIYIKNNETIKGLKEKQINGTVLKWWLYFGR